MKTQITIRKNEQTPTGYEVVNGDDKVLPIESTYKGEPKTLVLPENTANRKYCNRDKVDAAPNKELVLEYKESKNYEQGTPRKNWEEYLADDDKLILAELKARAEANRKAEQERLNSPEAKLQKQIERKAAEIAKLQAELDKMTKTAE